MKKKELMEQVSKNVINCKGCRLYQEAKNSVPGEGNPESNLAFIGEAPGAVEDETGRPFVGRAGKLLENLLGRIGYKREDVWVGNIIKHRPPGNRDPMPDEIRACAPYLDLQLRIMAPLLVVTLGRFAMNYFYKEGKISTNKGQLIKTDKYHIYPVYHPAAGLRNPTMLRSLEGDFLKIPAVLEDIQKGGSRFAIENDLDSDQLPLF